MEPERARNVAGSADGHLVAADTHRVDGVEVVGSSGELSQVDLQVEREVRSGVGNACGGQSRLSIIYININIILVNILWDKNHALQVMMSLNLERGEGSFQSLQKNVQRKVLRAL